MTLRPPRIIRRVIAMFTWDKRDHDVDQEISFHIESIKRDYMASGMSEDEAERAIRFGPAKHSQQGLARQLAGLEA